VPVRHAWLPILLSAGLALGFICNSSEYAAGKPPSPDLPLMLALLSDLQEKMAIPDRIRITVVEKNDRVISVYRNPLNPTEFTIRCERSFLELLTIDELRAAIAHELGHVWIFTHHPYLQTEELANRIAAKVVRAEDLNNIQSKSTAHLAQKSKLSAVLK
jgi:hypothetical protein